MGTLSYYIPKEWKLIAKIDESRSYEVDRTEIYECSGHYILVTAEGCSCWAGEYDVEWFSTLDELEASARSGGERRYNPSWKGLDELMSQARLAS